MPPSGQTWDSEFASRSPFFEIYSPLFERLGPRSSWPSAEELSVWIEEQRRLRAAELTPLRFIEMRPKSKRHRRTEIRIEELYDGSIELRGQIPCLPASFHDLFNALVFAAFPRAKRALHERQYRALRAWVPEGATRLPSGRTREQDALTIFDEGGSVLLMTEEFHRITFTRSDSPITPLHTPLAPRELAHLTADCVPLFFGHAILEQLHTRPKELRSGAQILILPRIEPGLELLDTVDGWLAERLQNPSHFTDPRADTVLTFTEEGRLWLGGAPQTSLSARRDDGRGQRS